MEEEAGEEVDGKVNGGSTDGAAGMPSRIWRFRGRFWHRRREWRGRRAGCERVAGKRAGVDALSPFITALQNDRVGILSLGHSRCTAGRADVVRRRAPSKSRRRSKADQSQRLEPIVAERLTILNGRFYMDEGLLNQKTGIGPSGRYNQTAPPSARGGHCEARETAETVGHLCERPKVPTKTCAVPTAVRRVEPRATTRTDVTLESLGPAVGVGAR